MSYWTDFRDNLVSKINVPTGSEAAQAVSDKISEAFNPPKPALPEGTPDQPPTQAVSISPAFQGIGIGGMILAAVVIFFLLKKGE